MKYTESNGYIVAEIDSRNFIIDSGCPISFNFCGLKSISIDGRQYPVNGMVPCRKEDADRITGMNVDGFIGMDVLKNTNLSIDYKNKEVFFGIKRKTIPDPKFYCMPISVFMGLYVMTDKIMLDGTQITAFIDTGAPISYVSRRIISTLTPLDEKYYDESPMFGRLSGNYYCAVMQFNSTAANLYNMNVKVGVFNEGAAIVETLGVDAVIDAHLLSEDYVVFDFENNMLGIALDERSKSE